MGSCCSAAPNDAVLRKVAPKPTLKDRFRKMFEDEPFSEIPEMNPNENYLERCAECFEGEKNYVSYNSKLGIVYRIPKISGIEQSSFFARRNKLIESQKKQKPTLTVLGPNEDPEDTWENLPPIQLNNIESFEQDLKKSAHSVSTTNPYSQECLPILSSGNSPFTRNLNQLIAEIRK